MTVLRLMISSRTTRSTTKLTAKKAATVKATIDRGIAARKARRRTPEINKLRDRQKRNFLATLFLSQGIPMLLGGDEIGRSQNGNNNGYCQDNEISWFDWESADKDLLEFTRQLIQLTQGPSGISPPPLVSRTADSRRAGNRYRLVYSRWSRDGRRALE